MTDTNKKPSIEVSTDEWQERRAAANRSKGEEADAARENRHPGTRAATLAEVERALVAQYKRWGGDISATGALSEAIQAVRALQSGRSEEAPAPEHAGHDWDTATNRCVLCAAYRHRASQGHPWAAGQWLYSDDGEQWGRAELSCRADD